MPKLRAVCQMEGAKNSRQLNVSAEKISIKFNKSHLTTEGG
ncbi:hypothetical protein N752_25975 [Desulforamulus aquiferis]|nr:hypothetical protein N752_25975 [Desulforamulus aquiferis]